MKKSQELARPGPAGQLIPFGTEKESLRLPDQEPKALAYPAKGISFAVPGSRLTD